MAPLNLIYLRNYFVAGAGNLLIFDSTKDLEKILDIYVSRFGSRLGKPFHLSPFNNQFTTLALSYS